MCSEVMSFLKPFQAKLTHLLHAYQHLVTQSWKTLVSEIKLLMDLLQPFLVHDFPTAV